MSNLVFASNPSGFDIKEKLDSLQRQKTIIDDLTSRLQAANLEYARLETIINAYKASIAPISKCPDEVLLMIFEFSTEYEPRTITLLLPVCRRWYQIGVCAPRLWNRINIVVPEGARDMEAASFRIKDQISMFLERCGSLSLHIDLDLRSLRSERELLADHLSERFSMRRSRALIASLINVKALARLRFPSMSHPNYVLDSISSLIGKGGRNMIRWGTLHVSLPPCDADMSSEICSLLGGAAPNLTKISIVDPDEFGNRIQFLSGFTDLPSLEDLTLHRQVTTISFPALNPASLKSLDLRCAISHHQEYLQLSRFTHLEHLTLYHVAPYSHVSNHSPQPATHVVCLPRLRTLTMHQCNYAGFLWDIPILQTFKVGGCAGDLADSLPDVKALQFCWNIFSSPYHSELEATVKSVLKQIISPERQTRRLIISVTLQSNWKSLVAELTRTHGSTLSLPVVVFSGPEVLKDRTWPEALDEELSESLLEL